MIDPHSMDRWPTEDCEKSLDAGSAKSIVGEAWESEKYLGEVYVQQDNSLF